MDAKTKIYLSVATQYVIDKEELKDEGDIAVRANEIVTDALLDNPLTEAGIFTKQRADDIIAIQQMNGEIESPYMEKPKFDYNKLREQSAIPACVQILSEFGKKSDSVFILSTDSDERSKVIDDAYNSLADTILKIFNENKVATKDFKYVFNNLKGIFESFESAISKKVDDQKEEILSRFAGAKNPGTNKFDINHSTYQQLVDARNKIFNDTGAKLEDYHTVVPTE